MATLCFLSQRHMAKQMNCPNCDEIMVNISEINANGQYVEPYKYLCENCTFSGDKCVFTENELESEQNK